jgi:hypothetical protein
MLNFSTSESTVTTENEIRIGEGLWVYRSNISHDWMGTITHTSDGAWTISTNSVVLIPEEAFEFAQKAAQIVFASSRTGK